jgi:hypothetical protein
MAILAPGNESKKQWEHARARTMLEKVLPWVTLRKQQLHGLLAALGGLGRSAEMTEEQQLLTPERQLPDFRSGIWLLLDRTALGSRFQNELPRPRDVLSLL